MPIKPELSEHINGLQSFTPTRKSAHMTTDNASQMSWDDIEEVEPDDIDKAMLAEIAADPECAAYVKPFD